MVATMTVKIHPNYEHCDMGELFKHFMGKTRELGLKGACFGCLGSHQLALDFSRCGEGCVFCGMKYTNPKGHAALDCPRMPGKSKVQEILKERRDK